MTDTEDTIVAIASAPGGGARAIVRVSGPAALACVARIIEGNAATSIRAMQQPAVQSATIAVDGFPQPLAVELWIWPNERSYTRQPLVELQLVGSPPLAEAVVRTLCQAGARLAQPGEFTLRAFLAGRLDLTQAEAVLGVIDAEGERELAAALVQLAGGLRDALHRLREELVDALADLEAGLDFVDEDIEFISYAELAARLARTADAVAKLRAQCHSRGAAGERPRVVLRGEPNTGKSSLFNALCQASGQRAAIVSEVAGTTRDYLTAICTLPGGGECLLVDTAGRDEAEHPIARVARSLAAREVESATCVLFCLDAARPLSEWERAELAGGEPSAVVLTKCDLARQTDYTGPAIATSSATGEGVAAVRQFLAQALAADIRHESGLVGSTSLRCQSQLAAAAAALSGAQSLIARRAGEELIAAELRLALDALGQVVGTVYTDDILGRIFGRFCIGK